MKSCATLALCVLILMTRSTDGTNNQERLRCGCDKCSEDVPICARSKAADVKEFKNFCEIHCENCLTQKGWIPVSRGKCTHHGRRTFALIQGLLGSVATGVGDVASSIGEALGGRPVYHSPGIDGSISYQHGINLKPGVVVVKPYPQ